VVGTPLHDLTLVERWVVVIAERWVDVLTRESASEELPAVDSAWFLRPNGHDASRTIHGVRHTLRVWVHAMELASALGFQPWQREALHCAAMWHDIGRTHDGGDYYHGAKSAGRAVGMGLHLEPEIDLLVLETALFTVTHHCGDEDHAKRAAPYLPDPDGGWDVFRVLKDADALDRVRLGPWGLDPTQLRFDVSHGRIARAREMYEASGS